MGALWEDLAQWSSYATLLHTALHICNPVAYMEANERKRGIVGRQRRVIDLVPAVLIAGMLALGGCVGAATAGGSPAAPGAGTSTPRTAASGTVWLCRPGQAVDPCTHSLATTSVPATGPRTVTTPTPAVNPAFDCFYIYPTVSTQRTDNSNLTIQPAEVDAAVAQASPFSTICRVWAPMYRQRTETSLARGLGSIPTADDTAYRSVLAAWRDYLAQYNDGRPVIFIGHSQGAAMLIRLLAGQIDPSTKLRGQMVSAIIAGGNVAVPIGRNVGSTFKHLPLCTSTGQDLVRHRLLELPRPSSGRQPVRPSWSGGQPSVRTDSYYRCPGGLRQPGRHRWRHCRPRPPVPHDDHASAGSLCFHPVGGLPRAVLGQLPEHARCDLVAGQRRGWSR